LLKTTEPERILLDSHFIKSSDVVPFLDMFDKLAGAVGAKAEVASVVIAPDNSGLLVTIKATGLFEALDKFLMLLENSSYELDFISMDIQKSDVGVVSDKNTPSSQWSAVFGIKLLSFVR
jgi:hypothetical protein